MSSGSDFTGIAGLITIISVKLPIRVIGAKSFTRS
jgi:hypothetical protein